jgi:ABC-type transporter Mla subunit MlaD
MRPTRYSPRASAKRSVLTNTLIGLAAIGLMMLFVAIGLRAPNSIPGRSYYTVTAELNDASNIGPHTVVRIGGVRVGQVLGPRFENGRPVVDLQLDTSVRPLLSSSTVRLRPQSAIGEPYVDLHPGRTGTPIPGGGRLTPGSTAAVPLDRVLSTFDPPTRQRFRTLMWELGKATIGTGHAGNRAIVAAPAMLADLQAVTGRLSEEPAAIRGLVSDGAAVAGALAGVRNELAAMFKPSADVMATVASEREALRATLDVAPTTLETVRIGLPHIDPALSQLQALAGAALPALRLAPNALQQASALFATARESVPPVNHTLQLADRAVSPTLSLLGTARTAAPWVDGTLKGALPTVTELAPRQCDIVRLARNWQNMFAFGEPKAPGQTLTVDVATPDFKSLGGNLPGPLATAVPWITDPYPAPCQSWSEVSQLAKATGR